MELLNSCRSAGGISWLCAVNHVALSPLHRAKLTISMLEDSRKRCYFAARRQTTCCTLFPIECNTGYGEGGKAGKTRMPARREAPAQESGALGPRTCGEWAVNVQPKAIAGDQDRMESHASSSQMMLFSFYIFCWQFRKSVQRQPTASCKRTQRKER